MNEKPIERLNYYNGQRLEADDLKLEQEYHIRVRRWLNKSLYSAGIADGLEVKPQLDDGKPTDMIVISPGLALDNEGREMILLEEARIKVVGQKSEKEGEVEGNYLFIQYREETMAEESDSCAPRSNGHKRGQLAWGGPSRVRAKPILGWSYSFPHESSGKVVLAQVELDGDCKVRNVYAYPRKYIGPASNMLVHQYALEGERHIDANNPGRIYFHIRGRQPNAVTLYLRAEKFSTLYYSELGQHNHKPTSAGTMGNANPSLDWSHFHDLKGATTKNDGADGNHTNHKLVVAYAGRHSYEKFGSLRVETELMIFPYGSGALTTIPPGPVAPVPLVRGGLVYDNILPVLDDPNRTDAAGNPDPFQAQITEGNHSHVFTEAALTSHPLKKGAGNNNIPVSTSYDHNHTLNADGTIGNAGVSDVKARSEPDPNKTQPKALTYVDHLQVYIGKADTPLPESPNKPSDVDNHTDDILNQLDNAQPTVGWLDLNGQGSLGNGNESHPLAKNGTGEIRLDLLSPNLSFPPGDYYIQLHVDSGGGRILYNLYVE